MPEVLFTEVASHLESGDIIDLDGATVTIVEVIDNVDSVTLLWSNDFDEKLAEDFPPDRVFPILGYVS